MPDDLPTPCILIDAAICRANIARMAAYAKAHQLKLRPHTKTHKSIFLGKMQLDHGAIGLTVAKPGEAEVMGEVCDDILMAYPAVDPRAAARLAKLAALSPSPGTPGEGRGGGLLSSDRSGPHPNPPPEYRERGRDAASQKTIRVGIDSIYAADQLSAAATAAGCTFGILVDLDIGHHRTGVQTPAEALSLAQHVSQRKGLRLDGVMFFPGQISMPPEAQNAVLATVADKLDGVLSLWHRSGLVASIVSGGSTPTAYQSHLIPQLTEIRPGTYIFNDMNCVRGGCATLEQCAARILSTVVSTAVPGQIVLDAGSKTLTSDRCGPAPDSGHGYILEYPLAKIVKLSEEHAQVDVTACDAIPCVGERVSIIPNHICPCVNLQDSVWWKEPDESPRQLRVDARGKVV